jgi:hypothetical protein
MDNSLKNIVLQRKTIRDENSDKPCSESYRRIIPTSEQNLQNIGENLVNIYRQLDKLSKGENHSSYSKLDAKIQLLEFKMDRIIDANLKMYNIEEDNKTILCTLQNIEKRFNSMESVICTIVENNESVKSSLINISNKYQVVNNELKEMMLENNSNIDFIKCEIVSNPELLTKNPNSKNIETTDRKIKSIEGDLGYLNSQLSNQSLNIEFIKDNICEFKELNEKLFFDNFKSIKKDINSQFEYMNEKNGYTINSQFDNFKDITTQEINSQFEYIENKLLEISVGNSTISENFLSIRNHIHNISEYQISSFNKTREICEFNIDETKKISKEIIATQNVINVLTTTVCSYLEDNSNLISINNNIDKINENILELKKEMKEGDIINEIIKFEESINSVEIESEGIYEKIDNIINSQISMKKNQKDNENTTNEKLFNIMQMQKENTYYFENISKNQQNIQEIQTNNKDRFISTSSKILDDFQQMKNSNNFITNKIIVIVDEVSNGNKLTKDLIEKVETNNNEYISTLQCEMISCRNNIIKNVNKSILSSNIDISGVNYSRNDGLRYTGKCKR